VSIPALHLEESKRIAASACPMCRRQIGLHSMAGLADCIAAAVDRREAREKASQEESPKCISCKHDVAIFKWSKGGGKGPELCSRCWALECAEIDDAG
jgi:hypothetical protein